MKIEYDCGCIVEYRFSAACMLSSRDDKKLDYYTPGTWSRKKGRPLISDAETMGNSRKGGQIQCTWLTPCGSHKE